MTLRSSSRALTRLLLALALSACRPPAAAIEVPTADERAPHVVRPSPAAPTDPSITVRWVGALLVDEHEGPTLFRRSGEDAAGYAWVEPGVEVQPNGAVRGGRVRVVIDGPLRTRGWMAVDGLAGVVMNRGRVPGTPVYVVPGDHVSIASVQSDTAIIDVQARFGHPTFRRSPMFRGALPLESLGAGSSGGGDGPTPGTRGFVRRTTSLRSTPDGVVMLELPALDPPLSAVVLRERGDWVGVRIGMGPYVVGYIPSAALENGSSRKQDRSRVVSEVLNPWRHRRRASDPRLPGISRQSGTREPIPGSVGSQLPPRIQEAFIRPLWRVPSGVRIEVDGATIAVFREAGFGVELARVEGRVELIAAVDSSVTVRGWIDARRLTQRARIASEVPETDAEPVEDDDG